jgi:CubicO group peptidase (beta-lactamase class C family)
VIGVKSLDDHLEAVLESGIQGVVALAGASSGSSEKAVGVANLENDAPLTPKHGFRIASMTKPFVAAVALQLVDEGALALDDEVGLVEGNVTVRQLLNHTSGLPNYAELDQILEPYRKNLAHRPGLTPRDVLLRLRLEHLGFWPGYTTIALASETGDRQAVVLANTLLWTDEAWAALGGLTWACYCGSDQTSA